MKKGIKVKTVWSEDIGKSMGPVFSYGVWWILVKWDDGSHSIVLEQSLEVINV